MPSEADGVSPGLLYLRSYLIYLRISSSFNWKWSLSPNTVPIQMAQELNSICSRIGLKKGPSEIGLATFASQIHKICSLKPEGDQLLYGVTGRSGGW